MSDQKNSLGMDQKTASWFAYVLSIVSAIILLATEKEDKTVRTHAWQSLILGCVAAVAGIILGILIWIPYIGILFAIIDWLLWIGFLVLSVLCIVKAVQGDIFKLPVIYNKAVNLK